MKLLSLKLGNADDPGWQFPEVKFKHQNLFVGESASGKSTLLNFVFSIGSKIAQNKGNVIGYVKLEFEHENARYMWEWDCRVTEDNVHKIFFEKLTKTIDGIDNEETILNRSVDELTINKIKTPKIAADLSAITTFKEDPAIEPVYKAFSSIMRRDFAANELNQLATVRILSRTDLQRIEKHKSLALILHSDFPLSARLFLLKSHFHEKYKELTKIYQGVFPFVEAFEFRDMSEDGIPGKSPYLHLKDKNAAELIPLHSWSSGMKKVLLIVTDVLMLPGGYVYLLDEYENSLGTNAVNFLPRLLDTHGVDNQFIITSHHPYLINSMPIRNWVVFHRKGLEVFVRHGEELVERYGKSKQQAFIKLLNDPFFTDGE